MANEFKEFYANTAPNTLTTAYTVPAGKTAIVREIHVANKTASAATAYVKIGNTVVLPTVSIPANNPATLPLHMIVPTGEIIQVQAGTSSAIDIRISGMEV